MTIQMDSRGLALASVALGLGLVASPALADIGEAKTIASGLSNPRGIALAPFGALYVAEAGSGGTGACTFSPPAPSVMRCYGETGAITRILPNGHVKRVLTGLPSLVLPTGSAEGGPVDISFFGMTAYITMSWGGDPALRSTLGGNAHLFGNLLRMLPNGRYQVVADITANEVAANPGGGAIDSNPYGLVALPGRRIIADAGANALIEVKANGSMSTFHVPAAPPGTRESVPTSVADGPDGALYTGLLTSFPFFQGAAQVQRIESDGSSSAAFASGLTAVVDVTFDFGGAMYVLEVARGHVGPFPPGPPNPGLGIGRLLRQCPGESTEVLLEGLTFPGGVAIGYDDAAYITNFGTSATSGEVLRLPITRCDGKRWKRWHFHRHGFHFD